MAVQFNAGAVEFPRLTVAGGNGKLTIIVSLLQTTSERNVIFMRVSVLTSIWVAFVFGYGLGLGSANCRKEGLGSGGSWHFAHKQSLSGDPSVRICNGGNHCLDGSMHPRV